MIVTNAQVFLAVWGGLDSLYGKCGVAYTSSTLCQRTNWGPVLKGLSSEDWDSVFTKITVGRGCKAQKIACGDKYFALSTSSVRGIIKIFRTRTCEELVEISHNERVLIIRLSASGDLLASYGRYTTKVWKLPPGCQIHIASNTLGANILSLSFTGKGRALLACTDDKLVRRTSLESTSGD